ncbi:putative secreted protein (Por secretion system target) [Neolewinella xylanilytica]|uniref:Putative secreted protein (Por secretion system target) n=1 Tax=Neolewinella xylanilytica TaxID=1514080 RepID=A0A2S6I2J6_9BACT|nr:T9SS type A sorting domain-containing protein [Neolewinella xylanilytica]PPK85406.1 putative secreted protein (Por secretion system target) [Neolewinella xylanilytica]
MKTRGKWYVLVFALVVLARTAVAQSVPEHSVARKWNEVYLTAIRNDLARPVVHARNLYHSAAAMYDAWSLINRSGSPALMGRTRPGYRLRIDPATVPDYPDKSAASREAISYAAYRLLLHRYRDAPGFKLIARQADQLMTELGFDPQVITENFVAEGPAALGNYIAAEIIAYGTTDGANERRLYENDGYPAPGNPPLVLGNPLSILEVENPNRWQPLAFPGVVIDQSGNILDGNVPGFLGATWGKVDPFAIPESAKTISTDQFPTPAQSPVYHDPGPPPFFNPTDTAEFNFYRWNFETVLKWSSHLDPADGVLWDISPGARGNIPDALPRTPAEYRAFYKQHEGGQPGTGRAVNPVTGLPYPPNVVPRGDYTRVLAEFWADGPQSETPPGHWFSILNTVMDHPLFERKLYGQGPDLPALEYDVKIYLALGGAMHDAAITAWSIKGKYDYVRPITAIRYLAVRGQATVVDHPLYEPTGIRLDPGFIELVDSAHEVVNTTIGMTVKARAWIGNVFIDDPDLEQAGVDWINPTVWEPYQRPTFVTPNFAGYISGHSTFSAAAATVLESLTGSPYFPGGVGEFVADKNEFLVFEEGPSQDIVLQWATYQDAAAETSLSRIWGGIHPPVDDIPGRRIGRIVGQDAVRHADSLFAGTIALPAPLPRPAYELSVFPNPAGNGQIVTVEVFRQDPLDGPLRVYNGLGQLIASTEVVRSQARIEVFDWPPGIYFLQLGDGGVTGKLQVR